MFDPVGLSGLSDEAAALDSPELQARARQAERLLRVDPLRYDALDAAQQQAWADMVLLQIAYGMEHSAGLSHIGIGDLQQSFRDTGPVSPEARIIRDEWFADGEEDAVSDGSWSLAAVEDPEED